MSSKTSNVVANCPASTSAASLSTPLPPYQDRPTLPLTDEVVQMLADHQARLPERHPHVLVLPARYAHIQDQLRIKGKGRWCDSRQKLIPKFNDGYGHELKVIVLSFCRSNVVRSQIERLTPMCPPAPFRRFFGS